MPDVGIHRKGEVDLPKLLKKLKRGLAKNVGAIGCFVGVVRGLSKKSEKVKIMNRVKKEIPIWKKEVTETRECWAHEFQE